MWHPAESHPPRVFVSYAGNDRPAAERLRQDLRERDIETFAFPPGGNFVLDINRALAQSDYFVLLWSRACVDRPWVDAEWSAALARGLQERRSFLFIVRLDTTPLPPLLAPRQYLDAFNNWDGLVSELAALWGRDIAVGEPVLPAPYAPAAVIGEVQRTIVLYIRNRALSVAHTVVVPAESTGQDLENSVRDALALPSVEEKFGGAVGMRFYYRLKKAGELISVDSGKLADSQIVNGGTIDLEVQVEAFGPGWISPIVVYRHLPSTGLSPATTRALINSAFNHLIPW